MTVQELINALQKSDPKAEVSTMRRYIMYADPINDICVATGGGTVICDDEEIPCDADAGTVILVTY